MDNKIHDLMTLDFQKPPNMDLPIDKYFAKQEEYHKLVTDATIPVMESTMVLQLMQHTGKVASLTKKTVPFRKRDPELWTW